MAGKKGMKKYPESIRNEMRQKQENGQSVKSLYIYSTHLNVTFQLQTTEL